MSDKENIQNLEDLLDISEEDAKMMYANKNNQENQKSLEEFDVTDGKYRGGREEQIAQARELEELLGIHEMNPYKTLNKEIFSQKIESMSVSDMTSLAIEVGVPPTQNTSQLKKQLIQSFDLYARRHDVNVPSPAQPIIDESSPNYENTVRLFKEF